MESRETSRSTERTSRSVGIENQDRTTERQHQWLTSHLMFYASLKKILLETK